MASHDKVWINEFEEIQRSIERAERSRRWKFLALGFVIGALLVIIMRMGAACGIW